MPFNEIIVGFDGSESSMEALRLTKLLRPDGGAILAVCVAETYLAAHTGFDAPEAQSELLEAARSACRTAEKELPSEDGCKAMVVDGRAGPALLATAQKHHADLVAVGSHSHSRVAGMLFGSVATLALHEAPCSVLVARPGAGASIATLTVGTDGSKPAEAAEKVARELSQLTGATLRRVTATGGKPATPDVLASGAEVDDRSAVDALVSAADSSDLLVVGTRGLHGLAALGSVAERVAHQAACSVLVVREPSGTDEPVSADLGRSEHQDR